MHTHPRNPPVEQCLNRTSAALQRAKHNRVAEQTQEGQLVAVEESMSKELWFAHYEEALAELEDAGVEDIESRASAIAFDRTRDQLADMIDAARDRRKYGE